MVCYWKWQMVFHVFLTSFDACSLLLWSLSGVSPFHYRTFFWGWWGGLTRKSIVMQLWPPTVRECLAAGYVLRTQCIKPQWTSVHKRFKQSIVPSETLPKMSCLGRFFYFILGGGTRIERTECANVFLTLCCVRNVSPCTWDMQKRTTNTH